MALISDLALSINKGMAKAKALKNLGFYSLSDVDAQT
tara:strand:+ start:1476 stop:1586 length:111 start_codon:yes stop_codon:yes gene_type:complete